MKPTVNYQYLRQYEHPFKAADIANLNTSEEKAVAESNNQTTLEDHLAGMQSPGAVIGGLTLITEVNQTTAGSSLVINNCFSADYDNYRLVISNFVSQYVGTSFITGYFTQSPAPTTGYYYGLTGYTYAGAAANLSLNNGSFWFLGYGFNTLYTSAFVDISNPFLARNKTYYTSSANQANSIVGGGYSSDTNSRTGLTIGNFGGFASQNFTATARVYGYRQT